MNNLPGIWNDPYCVAGDDDVDNVDVDPGEQHLALSQRSLWICDHSSSSYHQRAASFNIGIRDEPRHQNG